jgi:cysteine desulfurase
VAGILSVTIAGIEGETLLLALDDLAVSSGSACASLSAQPSYVLRALGRSDAQAQSSLRLSLGRYTTADDVDYAAARIAEEVQRLRAGAASRRTPSHGGDSRYSDEVRRRLRELPHWGLPAAGATVHVGQAGDLEQGAEVRLALCVVDGRVGEARFEAYGCPHLLAATSWLAEAVRGRQPDELLAWDWREAAAALQVPPAKYGRLLTLQDALRGAVRNCTVGPGSTV